MCRQSLPSRRKRKIKNAEQEWGDTSELTKNGNNIDRAKEAQRRLRAQGDEPPTSTRQGQDIGAGDQAAAAAQGMFGLSTAGALISRNR